VHGNISLIANYIYYYFQEASATQTTGVSTSVSKPDAGVNVSPADKMINAWNFFSEQTFEMEEFLWLQESGGSRTYPEFTDKQFHKTMDFSRPNNVFGI
jgi:hypothetical protein